MGLVDQFRISYIYNIVLEFFFQYDVYVLFLGMSTCFKELIRLFSIYFSLLYQKVLLDIFFFLIRLRNIRNRVLIFFTGLKG